MHPGTAGVRCGLKGRTCKTLAGGCGEDNNEYGELYSLREMLLVCVVIVKGERMS